MSGLATTPETTPWVDDPEFLMALERVNPPAPVVPEPPALPVAIPSAVPQPVPDRAEPTPIQVERGPSGVTIRTNQLRQALHTLTPEGLPTTKELKLEGFDVMVAGPGNFHQKRSYGPADLAVLGTEPGLADGLYKFSVSPRLQRIASLPGKSPLAEGQGGPVVLTRNGRNALDPDIQAAATLPRLEGTSGTFRIANGQLVQSGAIQEADPNFGLSDQDAAQ